ncbi:hypothetical protein HWV62_8771 [Athelia sp. TMB]|nr:hypothetical protein HWV62_8771 [Athelia sp. TMB]
MLVQEIFDVIIDFLHNDKMALATCSLTCLTWVPAARFHLFYEVTAHSETFPLLVKLLETSPHIRSMIKSLVVQGRDSQQRNTPARRRQSNSADIVLASKLAMLTTLIPDVKFLRISAVDWELFILENILHVLARTLSCVAHLDLERVKLRTFSHFTSLICSFPKLRQLSLDGISWDANSTSASVLIQPLAVDVSYLRNVGHARCLIGWLLAQDPEPEVRTFFMQVGLDEGYDVGRRLLQSALGASVQRLHLSLEKFTGNHPMQSK